LGTLYIIATPIGNLEDISLRAQRILGEVDVLASEDTRMTRKILSRYNIKPPREMLSYHEHNEMSAGKRLLDKLEFGLDIALCTDSGFPGISDPGYRIISEAISNNHEVEVIPGPSAVTTALVISGLPSSSFTFRGFPPRKAGQRRRFLEVDAKSEHTLIFFESPYRIHVLIKDALEVYGDRSAAVCLELTKKFERVHRGYLSELTEIFDGKKVKGEITVVIAGNKEKFIRSEEALDGKLLQQNY